MQISSTVRNAQRILTIAAISAITFPVISCAGPASFSNQNVSIVFTSLVSDGPTSALGQETCPSNPALPQPPSPGSALLMPNAGEGGVITILAQVTNASSANLHWAIYPQPNLAGITILPTGTSTPVGESTPSYGTFDTPGGGPDNTTAVGPTVYYHQNGVPVFSGPALAQAQAMGIPQGDTLVVATLQADPQNPNSVVTASQLIQHYGGTTAQGPPTAYLTPHTNASPAGLTNPVVSVAHNPALQANGTGVATNGQYQFYGGVIGAAPCLSAVNCLIQGTQYPLFTTDNAAIWEVGPAPFSLATAYPCTTIGTTCPFGTISSTGLYTAPAVIPSSGLNPANEVVVVVVSALSGSVDQFAYVGLY